MLISAGADLNLANKVCNTINILNFSMIIESFILIFLCSMMIRQYIYVH